MSTRNITVRSSHSGEYTARWWTVTKDLEALGAKAFGSLQRREERLERFRLAAAKKEAKQKASQERLDAAIRAEQERVQTRSRSRAQEILDEAEDDETLREHVEFVTSGMEAEEFLQWKLSEAWAGYRAATTQEDRHAARAQVNRAMRNLRDFHDGNPLHVLAATAEMLNAYGNDSDSEDSDYTEGSS